jgi:glycine amidinotransferase
MLDPNTVIVEQEEPELQTFLRNQGFDVVPVPFRNFCAFGGSFHCATLDIRRNGTLESIF